MIVHMTVAMCETERSAALRRLGMTLEQARAQWDDCGCCLINGNWDDLQDLDRVKEMDYLLDQ